MYILYENMTWIPMEIPYHFMSQMDDGLVKIDTKFHDYSMSFIQVLFVFHIPKHDMDFTEIQVMEFRWHERENDRLAFIGFGVIFHQTAINKTGETPFNIFYRDGMIYFYIVNLLFGIENDSLKSYITYSNFTFHTVINYKSICANGAC